MLVDGELLPGIDLDDAIVQPIDYLTYLPDGDPVMVAWDLVGEIYVP